MSDQPIQATSTPEWFAAKTVCRHERDSDGKRGTLFEERVVLLRATDFDDAIAKGEIEVQEYCRGLREVAYVEYINVYRLEADTIGDGTEVFSLMRESKLSDSDYLDHFYDDDNERTQIAE
jgi:hypothetical protein